MSHLNNSVTQPGVQELGNLFLSVTGGAVFYVGPASQIASLGDVGQGITGRTFTSVNAALAQCVSGRGDVIYLLPGYTESISAADAWSSLAATDVTVIGMGRGTNRPALTWTAATSSVLFDVANFRLRNCRLFLAGANAAGSALTVAAPITISAAGCAIQDCDVFFGFDADQIVTIGITTTADADDLVLENLNCYAATAAECTTFLQLVGADRLVMRNVSIQGATSSTTVGTVRFLTTASTQIRWENCTVQNMKAVSVHAVTCMNGVTGQVVNCNFGILDNSTLAGWIPGGAGNGPQLFRCQTTNLAAENSAATTPVST